MNESDWKSFLTDYNRELLSYEELVEDLPAEVLRSKWMGYPGASEADMTNLEQRLGTRLPPSYRAFLKVSNGWRSPSIFIHDLLPVSGIGWFQERNQDWIDAYADPDSSFPPIPDADYLAYGEQQSASNFRAEYLQTALQVSERCDGAVLLLNPKIFGPTGEWEVWFFANWYLGAVRYQSFADWLSAEREASRNTFTVLPDAEIKKRLGAAKPGSTKKAQAAVRSGLIKLALPPLENFAASGDDAAAASLAELYAFQGEWEKVIPNAGRLIANPYAVYAGNVFDDMISLLGCAGRCSGKWDRVIATVENALKVSQRRVYNEFNEYHRERELKIFQNLIAYAQRRGEPPHELLAIFGVSQLMDEKFPEEREAWYKDAVANVDKNRPDLKKNPQAKPEYFFFLAKGVVEDEALRIYEAHGSTFLMRWQAAEYMAGLYVRRGNPDKAWAAIENNLSDWGPVDHAQVAPVVLLIDQYLRTLMTPERCQLVLSTTRGL